MVNSRANIIDCLNNIYRVKTISLHLGFSIFPTVIDMSIQKFFTGDEATRYICISYILV